MNRHQDSIRVLMLVASSRGGGAANVRDLATNLDRSDYAIQVAMPEDGGNVQQADFATLGIPFHVVDIAAGLSPSALAQIRRWLATVDLLHVQGARAALFGRLAALGLSRRPRIVYSIQGFAAPFYPFPRRQILLGVERALAPAVDRFVAVSHAEKQALIEVGVATPERIAVIWNGIDVARYAGVRTDRAALRAGLGVPVDGTLLMTACRLYKPRDFDTLLQAMRQVVDACASAHLVIVGDGPLRGEIEAQISALDLTGHVTLAGWRRDMPAVYQASDLFVLTTWGWEGLPLSIAEAMAAGLPVVATRAGGIPEIVVEHETGLLVERRDPAGLAAALQTMAQDADLRRRAGEAGRQRAARHFDLHRMVEETTVVYRQVLAQQQG
jgi:glycosyltransferase involved in cell wall biosynthesis